MQIGTKNFYIMNEIYYPRLFMAEHLKPSPFQAKATIYQTERMLWKAY